MYAKWSWIRGGGNLQNEAQIHVALSTNFQVNLVGFLGGEARFSLYAQ
jgi:hypothetical protein